MNTKKFLSDLRTLFSLMGRHKFIYFFYSVISEIGSPVINIGIAWAMKQIADYFTKGTEQSLRNAIYVAGILFLYACFIFPVLIYIKNKRMEMIMRDLRVRLFRHLQKLPVNYYEKHHSGNIMSRINKDTESTRGGVDIFGGGFVWSIMGFLMLVPYIIVMDWRFGLIGLCVSVLVTILNIKFIIPMREKSNKIHEKTAVMTETITDNVTGFNVIKMFGLKSLFIKKFKDRLEEVIGYQKDWIKLRAIVYPSNVFIGWLNSSLLAIVGVYMVFQGMMEVGVLVGTLPVLTTLTWYIIAFTRNMNTIQEHFAGTGRLGELFDEETEPERYKTGGNSPGSGIMFRNAVYGYDENMPVIDGLSIDVPIGKTAALVGDSGGGKSTIIKLCMGMYELWEGEMVLNGKAVSEYALDEMRKLAAYVPQDAYIFDGTIRENILYGNQDADEDEMLRASKQANAHEFVLQQPAGYETLVGERGIRLSGGQRQRVAIARAILKGASILLLDEATSSLDSESEEMVQEALDNLIADKTCIVAAHRLSTIEKADIIYFIKEGIVAEEGTHAELLKAGGLYSELYYREFAKA